MEQVVLEVEPRPTMEGISRYYRIGNGSVWADQTGFRRKDNAWHIMYHQTMAISGVAYAKPDPNSMLVAINRKEDASWDTIHPAVVEMFRFLMRDLGVTSEVVVEEVPFRNPDF